MQLYPGMRYPMPSTASGTALLIAARTCSSFGRTASGCAAMYSSTDFGTLFFIPLILWFRIRFRSPITVWPSGSSGDPFHTASVLPFIELCRMQRWGLTWTCSRLRFLVLGPWGRVQAREWNGRFTSKWRCQCGCRMLADFSGVILSLIHI